MIKEILRRQIIHQLEADYQLLLQAAKSAHEAAIHEDNIPDSKYETLALEASYLAKGQANRAQEIKQALDAYRQLILQTFTETTPIRLTALVDLADQDGNRRKVFLGPVAGGLKLAISGFEVMVVTPDSPLGDQLLGLQLGDSFDLLTAAGNKEYEIIAVG